LCDQNHKTHQQTKRFVIFRVRACFFVVRIFMFESCPQTSYTTASLVPTFKMSISHYQDHLDHSSSSSSSSLLLTHEDYRVALFYCYCPIGADNDDDDDDETAAKTHVVWLLNLITFSCR
jgi:hypothetical protein